MGHGDEVRRVVTVTNWKRRDGRGVGPSVGSGCSICFGGFSLLRKDCLCSFTSVDMEMAGHQVTDWAIFFSVYSYHL